nr:hypothetical protein Itr_chr15CG10540 [Ipomoea trifida]
MEYGLIVRYSTMQTGSRWLLAANPPPLLHSASASTLLDGRSPPRLRHKSSPLPPLCFCFHLRQIVGRRLAALASATGLRLL